MASRRLGRREVCRPGLHESVGGDAVSLRHRNAFLFFSFLLSLLPMFDL